MKSTSSGRGDLVGAIAVADGGVDKRPVVVGGRDSPETDPEGV